MNGWPKEQSPERETAQDRLHMVSLAMRVLLSILMKHVHDLMHWTSSGTVPIELQPKRKMVEIARNAEVDTPLAMRVRFSSIRILQRCDHCLLDLVPIFYCEVDPLRKHVEKREQEKEEEHLDIVGRFLSLSLFMYEFTLSMIAVSWPSKEVSATFGRSTFRFSPSSSASSTFRRNGILARNREKNETCLFPRRLRFRFHSRVIPLYVRHHHLRLIIVRVIDDGIEHLHRDEEKEQEERIEQRAP